MAEIDSMVAGPELDRLVGKEVIGCRVVHCRDGTYKLVVLGSFDRVDFVTAEGAWSACPKYSTDVAAAWEVVGRVVREYPNAFAAAIMDELGIEISEMPHSIVARIFCELTPLLICRAALKTVKGETHGD